MEKNKNYMSPTMDAVLSVLLVAAILLSITHQMPFLTAIGALLMARLKWHSLQSGRNIWFNRVAVYAYSVIGVVYMVLAFVGTPY